MIIKLKKKIFLINQMNKIIKNDETKLIKKNKSKNNIFKI